MQFSCVARGKSTRSIGTISSGSESAAFVDLPIDEDEFHDGAAYGFNQRKTDGKSNNQWKHFVCGPKPTLTRSCTNRDCPSVERPLECKDRFSHCNLPVLERYCALPQFRSTCCQSCTKYLSK